MKMIDAAEFEKDVRRFLDEVQATGTSLTVTREGRPIVEMRAMEPHPEAERPSLLGALAHPEYRFDRPFDPAVDPEEWDAVRGEWEPRD